MRYESHPDVGGHLTYKVEDDPDSRAALLAAKKILISSSRDMLKNFEYESPNLVNPNTDASDHRGVDLDPVELDFEAFPVLHDGSIDTVRAKSILEKHGIAASPTKLKSLEYLGSICTQWSADPNRWETKIGAVSSENEKLRRYVIALLKDDDGEVVAFVADAPEESNAVYIWRRDGSDTHNWQDVFRVNKKQARETHMATRVVHKTTYEDRIMDLLTMPVDDYLERVTKPKRVR